nr:pentatricopeptide repeat-containing protein [Quercus suber]
MRLHFKQLFGGITLLNSLTTQQTRCYARDPFPNKISHYLYRAKLIDSIRLGLRSNPSSPTSLAPILNDRLLDSFVVTQALRSAPSADSALSLVETLETIPHFSHTQNTLHALAAVLAKSCQTVQLKGLIDAINAGSFGSIRVSFMNLMQWYAAIGDLELVLRVWDEYRLSSKRICTESYNIVMGLYVQMGKDTEAVEVFDRMIDAGAIPNSRTYTIVIEHLMNSGKLDSAMEVFNTLPLMRIRRTLKQYSILVEGFIGVERFDEVKTLLDEMQADGKFPGRALLLSLRRMNEAGFVQETDEFLKAMSPDERIKNIGCSVDSSDDDDDDEGNEVSHASGVDGVNGVQLKPWLDPRALASALQHWNHEDVSALEDAKLVWTTRLVCKILRHFNSPETAWKFFCWAAYQPGFTHDVYSVERMMALSARHGRTELVDKLMSKIRREGMRLPFSTIRLIIDFYGLSKKADAALKVFHYDRTLCGPISKLNMMLLYSSLLRTLTKCGRNSDSMDILEEMILGGICPDIQTFSGLMYHFALNGDIKTVQKLFAMVRQSGVEPDAYMFKVLIQAYCKAERAALAWRVFEDLRNSNLVPDANTKELLVKSLWKEGKRREAAAVEENCDTFSNVSTNSYENLTNYHVIEEFNPDYSPTLLPVGTKVTLPLFCSCPSKARTLNRTKYFITYVWQPGDDVTQVGAKFEASSLEISNENKNTAVGLPILIPESQLPFLSRTNLADIIKAKHWWILIAKSLGGALSVLFLTVLLVYTYCSLMRKKGSKGTHQVQTDEPQVSLDKLLIHGVSDYLGRPVMYEINAIMEATMNLYENCRIGGSMYKAIIDEKILAVKKSEEDITEELKILHKFKAKIANFSVAKSTTNLMMLKMDIFAFGVVMLELLLGRKAIEVKETGEAVLSWKEIKGILEVEEKREERLKKWMDPNLESLYPINGALSLAALGRACTQDDSSARPSMAEIVFNLSVIIQSSSKN